MARPPKPQDADGELPAATELSDDPEALIAQSRKPVLAQQADRALGPLARRIRAARDAAREQDPDAQAVKDLSAALRRVRAEVTRRSEAGSGDAAGGPDRPGAAGAAGARPARAPGPRAGRPGARKVPKPSPQAGAETVTEPAAAELLVKPARPAEKAAGPAATSGAAAPPPAPRGTGAGLDAKDKAEKKARKEAEKAERKRVREAEKAEEKTARKLQKEAEKAAGKAERQAGKKAGKRAPETSEA